MVDLLQILSMNLQTIVFAIVIALVTYISFYQTRNLFTKIKLKQKVPEDFVNTVGPLVIYSIALAGIILFAYELSVLFTVSDMALAVIPSILMAAVIISATWILLNVSKHSFNLLQQRKKLPSDIIHTISIFTKYGIVIFGLSLSILNVL